MGCMSSKILTRSGTGSLREKANRGFQRSGLIEEIIRSNSKSNGDQFLALLRTSSSAARRSKADAAEQRAADAKIETIDVSELLAGLEEEEDEEGEERGRREDRKEGEKTSPRCVLEPDGATGGARSFRTLAEFDAMVSRCSSPEQATVLAPEPGASLLPPPPPPQSSSSEQAGPAMVLAPEPEASLPPPPLPPKSSLSEQDAVATASSAPGQGELARGAKRRARARQLGELRAPSPAAFDFRKSGSLRDWLLGGGPIFSPGSYVTPKFGKVPPGPEEHGERRAVFDPELVAQLEEAMEELSVDEERVLREVLEALELEAGETETVRLQGLDDRAAAPVVAVQD